MTKQTLAAGFALLALSCAKGDSGTPATSGDPLCAKPTFVKPEGHVGVAFEVDLNAVQGAAVEGPLRPTFRKYADGEIQWKGSLIYDARTNVATFDASWAAERGPYPAVYDDGPICEGGHEPPGAVKGDGKFSAHVYVKPGDADVTFEYGAVNEFGNWIWEGPNGSFVLKARATEDVRAAGYKPHAYGSYNVKIALDTATMHADFKPFDPTTQTVWLKGSMNSWTPVQLRDDGQKGDERAGDGVYTYEHRANLGAHDGMLYDGQHVQFTFVFNSAEGTEYKATGNGLSAGVKVWVDAPTPGTWRAATIALERESRGRAQNTTVVVGGGGGGTTGLGPEVLLVEPATGPTGGGTAVVLTGMRFAQGATVAFGGATATDVQVVSETEMRAKTPAHAAGAVDVKVTNADGTFGVYVGGFSFAGTLGVASIMPDRGSPAGGTAVTITGTGFEDGATVKFGDAPATDVVRRGATEIACKTPSHALGAVSVVVKNPDNASGSKTFTYAAPVGWAILQHPSALSTTVGVASEFVYGRVFVEGVTPGAGRGVGVRAQVGYGALGSAPDATWTWADAEWNADAANDDEYRARITPAAAGTFDVAFRFSSDDGATWVVADRDGATNGWSAAQAAKLTVTAPGSVSVASVAPDFGSVAATTAVTITGAGFAAGASVTFGGAPATGVQVVDATHITAIAPKRMAGAVDVEVSIPNVGTGKKVGGFSYVSRIASPPSADGSLAEWTADYLVASQNAACAGGWGAQNHLDDLYFAYDDSNLYMGIRGATETGTATKNGIIIYIDTVAGSNGHTLADFTDKTGLLDAMISGTYTFSDPAFMPEFAAGSIAMASVATGVCSDSAGVRGLSNVADFAWVCTGATVASGSSAVELVLPRAAMNLSTNGKLAVLLTNSNGTAYSNETLPARPGAGCTGAAPVFAFELR